MQKKVSTRQITIGGLLVALCVILGFYNLYLVPPRSGRITFRFIPLIYASIIMGPGIGAAIGFISDILIYFLTPGSPGAFFPGFTVTAILMGLVPGLIIRRKKEAKIIKIILVALASFFITWFLDSLWLSVFGKTYIYYLTIRFLPNILQMVITVFALKLMLDRIPVRDFREK